MPPNLPDKKSFCHNGIFSTITKILSQHQNQNTKTIDLYEDKLHEGKKQLIESYKKKVLWAERIYFISPIWWFRLTPKMETFFDEVFSITIFINFDKAMTLANKKDVKFFDLVDEEVWQNLSNSFTLFNSKAYQDMRN